MAEKDIPSQKLRKLPLTSETVRGAEVLRARKITPRTVEPGPTPPDAARIVEHQLHETGPQITEPFAWSHMMTDGVLSGDDLFAGDLSSEACIVLSFTLGPS